MNQFQKMAKCNPRCDICGEPMVALYGGGFDNDRLFCSSREWRGDYCGAEIVFPTSTFPTEGACGMKRSVAMLLRKIWQVSVEKQGDNQDCDKQQSNHNPPGDRSYNA